MTPGSQHGAVLARLGGRTFARALAAMSVVALSVVLPAGAASASVAATITITGPPSSTVSTSGQVTITGNAAITQQALETNTITDLRVTLSGAGGASCDLAGCGASAGGGATNFSYPTPALAYNGPYTVTATVSANECLLPPVLKCTGHSATATSSFEVAVAPRAPSGIKTQINSDNSVSVTWNANPEPDVVGYQVVRQAPGGSGDQTVDPFTTSTSFTDKNTSSGGVFSYAVIVFRPAGDGVPTNLLHASSGFVSANVPLPPAPDTTSSSSLVPGQTIPVTTSTTVAPAPDISQFINQAKQAGALTPKPKVLVPSAPTPKVQVPAPGPTLPNTFAPTLPYPASSGPVTTSGGGGGGGSHVALPAQPASSSPSHRSVLFSVAGGLFLCLLGLTVRFAGRRSRAPELEPIDAEAVAVGATGATKSHRPDGPSGWRGPRRSGPGGGPRRGGPGAGDGPGGRGGRGPGGGGPVVSGGAGPSGSGAEVLVGAAAGAADAVGAAAGAADVVGAAAAVGAAAGHADVVAQRRTPPVTTSRSVRLVDADGYPIRSSRPQPDQANGDALPLGTQETERPVSRRSADPPVRPAAAPPLTPMAPPSPVGGGDPAQSTARRQTAAPRGPEPSPAEASYRAKVEARAAAEAAGAAEAGVDDATAADLAAQAVEPDPVAALGAAQATAAGAAETPGPAETAPTSPPDPTAADGATADGATAPPPSSSPPAPNRDRLVSARRASWSSPRRDEPVEPPVRLARASELFTDLGDAVSALALGNRGGAQAKTSDPDGEQTGYFGLVRHSESAADASAEATIPTP